MTTQQRPAVKRNLKVLTTTPKEIVVGGIYQYTGSSHRLSGTYGLLLVHRLHPVVKGQPMFDTAVVEVLPSDTCLFWVEKNKLAQPSEAKLKQMLEIIQPSNSALEAIAKKKQQQGATSKPSNVISFPIEL